jgi:membrane fusion protein (multidrug efflux system)
LIRANLAPANERSAPTVKLLLESGATYPETAMVTFVDNAVDVHSGTVRVRAVLSNPDARLIPGQFIRAKVEGVLLDDVVTIPRKAVMSSAQGSFVWLVAEGEKVEMRPVKTGRTMGNDIIVLSGLEAGERYVVEGVLKVQPGIQVSAVSVDAAARQAEIGAQHATPQAVAEDVTSGKTTGRTGAEAGGKAAKEREAA